MYALGIAITIHKHKTTVCFQYHVIIIFYSIHKIIKNIHIIQWIAFDSKFGRHKMFGSVGFSLTFGSVWFGSVYFGIGEVRCILTWILWIVCLILNPKYYPIAHSHWLSSTFWCNWNNNNIHKSSFNWKFSSVGRWRAVTATATNLRASNITKYRKLKKIIICNMHRLLIFIWVCVDFVFF